MKIVPQYAFDPGTQLSLHGRELIIAQVTANGYEVVDAEQQSIEVISFTQWVSYLKMPGTAIEYVQGPSSAAQARLGELRSSANTSEASQQEAMFRFSLCTAMRLHEQQLRDEYGARHWRAFLCLPQRCAVLCFHCADLCHANKFDMI